MPPGKIISIISLILLGAVVGLGIGYACWGVRALALQRDLERARGWLAEEMRANDGRSLAAKAQIREAKEQSKQFEANGARLQAVLRECQDEWRAAVREQKRLVERMAELSQQRRATTRQR